MRTVRRNPAVPSLLPTYSSYGHAGPVSNVSVNKRRTRTRQVKRPCQCIRAAPAGSSCVRGMQVRQALPGETSSARQQRGQHTNVAHTSRDTRTVRTCTQGCTHSRTHNACVVHRRPLTEPATCRALPPITKQSPAAQPCWGCCAAAAAVQLLLHAAPAARTRAPLTTPAIPRPARPARPHTLEVRGLVTRGCLTPRMPCLSVLAALSTSSLPCRIIAQNSCARRAPRSTAGVVGKRTPAADALPNSRLRCAAACTATQQCTQHATTQQHSPLPPATALLPCRPRTRARPHLVVDAPVLVLVHVRQHLLDVRRHRRRVAVLAQRALQLVHRDVAAAVLVKVLAGGEGRGRQRKGRETDRQSGRDGERQTERRGQIQSECMMAQWPAPARTCTSCSHMRARPRGRVRVRVTWNARYKFSSRSSLPRCIVAARNSS